MANEVLAVVLVAFAILVFLSLASYNSADASFNSVGPERPISNLIGHVGAYLSDGLLQVFGLASLALPIVLVVIAYRAFFGEGPTVPAAKLIGSGLLLVAISGLLSLFPQWGIGLLKNSRNGGVVGYLVEGGLASFMNTAGAAIVLVAASILTVVLTMEVSLAAMSGFAGSVANSIVQRIAANRQADKAAAKARVERSPRREFPLVARFTNWVASWQDKRALAKQRAASEDETTRRVRLKIQRELEAKQEALRAPEDSPADMLDAEFKVDAFDPQADAVEPAPKPAVTKREVAKAQVRVEEPAAAGVQAKQDAQDAMKAHRARHTPTESEITMDPEVAEMVSTASIVRTVQNSGSGSAAPAPVVPAEKSERRSFAPKQADLAGYKLPDLGLLEAPIGHHEQAEDELRERATVLAEKCKEFSVTGHIHRINPGPVVTTFEFKPDPGVKYSRVVSLAEDLCLALKAESIRIDRIPGKSTVGIEVPNAKREKIFLREVIESPKFQKSESRLTIALGKTINGEEYIADLMRMPHLLIAGATGAGKSVTLNAIICSILYKGSPENVKFIMVDPKRLELGLYEGIPHLLTPIVTEPKRAANALKWAVNEMENRYRELAKFGVRNIDQYNAHIGDSPDPRLFGPEDPNIPKKLPYIMITIDELADLMMVARADVETSIARLAQMARAVGIHLVVATQRPSVDVITGVIKANFPSRIAFRVSSKVDSRTIIDSNGAEGLLGQGDMLFLPPASSRLVRVHGSFVNEAEIKRITDYWRNLAQPDYNEEVTQSAQESDGLEEGSDERDELFDEALAIVTDMGRASTSVLQRRLSIGYGRAAKLLDVMERGGFIGPTEGAKPRKVLPAAYEFRERLDQRLQERAP